MFYLKLVLGGVGNSTTNVLWLKADDLSLADEADISTWVDASGNSNDFSQPNSSFAPIFKTSILNGNPVARFSKANGRIRRNSFSGLSASAITAIYVNKNNGESQDATISYNLAGTDNEFLLFSSNSLSLYRVSSINSGVSFNDNDWHITNASWQSSGGTVDIWKDGVKSFTGVLASGGTLTSGGTLAIGAEQDSLDGDYDSTQSHSGDFAEVMIFNTFLNDAQQIIVSNYLASKYNLTISNDNYAHNVTHGNDLAGIGRVNVSNTHTSAMSSGVLQIENPNDLGDNEFLFFGHDNADITSSWTTTEAPNSGVDIQRLAREWRIDETGDLGTNDFIIETTNMPALPAMHTMYVLMVDTDGDFSSGATIYEMSLDSGTRYKSSGVNISDGDYVAIGVINPKIEHTTTASSGTESVNASIGVSLNFIPNLNKTVEFSTSGVTATPGAGNDYTEETNTVITVLAGNNTANYSITINDDGTNESSETLTSTLSNPSAGLNLGSNTVHTYTITDNDNTRKVNFDVSSASNNENVSPVTVNLSLSSADATNPTSVDYSVTGGTATSVDDFTLSSGTVTFPATTTTNSFSFTINDDLINESNETIIITLSNPVNCNIGVTGTYTYTINDDDANPTIQFNSTSSSNSESTTSVNIQVDLSASSGVDTSANYTISGSASGSGVDYVLSDGVVTVSAGNTIANINAVIVNDSEVELDETIIITLSAPVNGTLGTNTVHTYTITNDDSFGNSGPGGVGDSSSNLLWLKAEDLSLSDNDDVSTWNDMSGNGNNLTQETASLTPTYKTNIVNGYPVVRFDKSNNRIRKTNFSFAVNEITAFYVGRTSDSGDAIFSYNSSGNDNDFLLYNSNNLSFYRGASNIATTGVDVNDNNWHINAVKWKNVGGDYEIWKDGSITTGTNASGTVMTSGGTLALGGEQDVVDGGYNASEAHSGDFAEVIIYNSYLNKAQQIIVSNYLAAKYNITLSDNNLVPVAAAGYYYEDVTGIGQADDGSFHLDSEGSGIVRIDSPSDLGNDEFLFVGREVELPASRSKENSASKKKMFSYNFATNTGGNYRERINSRWRVRRRNNLGTVRVWLNLNGIDLSGMPSCSTLELVVGSNRNLLTTTRYPLIEYGGGYYYANNVSFSNNDYFSVEFTDKIVLNGTQFLNGSGDSNRPNTSDDCFKLLVTSDATGSLIQNEDANVREIEVESGGHLVIGDGNRIQVSDGIVVNGDIRLVGSAQVLRTSGTNNVSGTGSLFRDQESVSTTVYQSGYWSSPVTTNGSTYTIGGVLKDGSVATTSVALAGSAADINFTNTSVLDGSKTTPITISGRWLAKLVNATDWTREIDPSTETFNPGEGWNMKTTGGGTQNFTFVGIPNDGTYTSSIDQGRLSLLGNPYPSALDADAFISDNASSITGTLYFYDAGNDTSHSRSDYTGGYATRVSGMGTAFSGGSAPARYIPIGQGFFVTREAAGTGTVTFQNSQRAFETVGGSSLFYSKSTQNKKKTAENNFPILKLGFEFDIDGSKKYHRQLAIGFRGLSSNFEAGFDAEMFDRQPSDLALTVSDKDSPFVILGTEYYNEDIEIPLKLNLDKNREVTFKIDEVLNLNASIYIYDNVEAKTYKISDSPLTLNLSLGEYNDRFSIIFKNRTSIALDVEDEIRKNGISIYHNSEVKELVIKSNQGVLIEKVSIFNLLGQEINTLKINEEDNELRIKTDIIKNNLYIVKLNTDKGILSKKILLK